jgi:predicted SAM-dependent methyltransferase
VSEAIKLNLGCASRLLEGYVNIDLDDLPTLRQRYPNIQFPEGIQVFQCDIFKLPYGDGTVAEVRADSLLEHLSFLEEPRFFYEMRRVLRVGGLLNISVPDFEKTIELWIAAKDDWKDFYSNTPEAIAQEHWFGNYSYSTENRWGYLCASIFGPQNAEGQFHKNCYTVPKIRAILRKLEFKELSITNSRWKGNRDIMIDVVAERM